LKYHRLNKTDVPKLFWRGHLFEHYSIHRLAIMHSVSYYQQAIYMLCCYAITETIDNFKHLNFLP